MITCGKSPTKLNPEMFQKENQYVFFVLSISITVELGDKELFGHPKIVPYLTPNVPYHKHLTKAHC